MEIKELTKALQLQYIGGNFKALVDEARNTRMGHGEFLAWALEQEIAQRKENRLQRRIREARFPLRKYIQDLNLGEYAQDVQAEIEGLQTLDFIAEKENAILIGNPGRGKTHAAIGIGIAACLADLRVLFTNVPNLVIDLKESMSRSEFGAYKRKFERFDLVIVDELGYVSFDKAGNEILFNLLSNRNDAGSMIVTTNLAFERWEGIFGDAILAGALVDRIAHKAHVLDMSGDSYRLKDTKRWLETRSPAADCS